MDISRRSARDPANPGWQLMPSFRHVVAGSILAAALYAVSPASPFLGGLADTREANAQGCCALVATFTPTASPSLTPPGATFTPTGTVTPAPTFTPTATATSTAT